jgi:prevent-host-death family protein
MRVLAGPFPGKLKPVATCAMVSGMAKSQSMRVYVHKEPIMPNPIPQTVPISELRRQQDKILKMAESAPVVLMSRSEPAGVLVSPQEWNQIVNRLRQLEAIHEARHNLARNEADNSWVSSAEMRRRMQNRGVDVGSLVRP